MLFYFAERKKAPWRRETGGVQSLKILIKRKKGKTRRRKVH